MNGMVRSATCSLHQLSRMQALPPSTGQLTIHSEGKITSNCNWNFVVLVIVVWCCEHTFLSLHVVSIFDRSDQFETIIKTVWGCHIRPYYTLQKLFSHCNVYDSYDVSEMLVVEWERLTVQILVGEFAWQHRVYASCWSLCCYGDACTMYVCMYILS